MERPGVKITRLCPIIVQFFLWKGSVHTNSILECLRVSTFGPLWLRLLGNAFLANLLVCGIGHSTWPWNVRVWTWPACCPRLDKAWSSFFTKHTFYPRVPDQSVTWQEGWGRLSSQCGGRFLSSFLKGLGTIFHLAVARNVEHPFLRPPTTYNPVVYATKYALQSERDCIAQRLDVAETLQELADAIFEENWHALRLVDPFLLPVVARRNLLVMREVSVVISWVNPKLIVDLFFGLAPTWVGHACSNNAVARSASRVSN